MIILTRSEIEALIDFDTAAKAIEDAYVATSLGRVNLPPVGHITFAQDADCHIKYGHMDGDPTFVFKVATGFPQNDAKGLPSGNGLILVMSSETGMVEAMLHDEMMLTDIRTGIGGAIASRALARENSQSALVLGTGPQARRQIEAHTALLPSLSFRVWGRTPAKVKNLISEMAPQINVKAADDLEGATGRVDIIITSTGSKSPILKSDWVRPGTHITAVGADAQGKQELDIALVARDGPWHRITVLPACQAARQSPSVAMFPVIRAANIILARTLASLFFNVSIPSGRVNKAIRRLGRIVSDRDLRICADIPLKDRSEGWKLSVKRPFDIKEWWRSRRI